MHRSVSKLPLISFQALKPQCRIVQRLGLKSFSFMRLSANWHHGQCIKYFWKLNELKIAYLEQQSMFKKLWIVIARLPRYSEILFCNDVNATYLIGMFYKQERGIVNRAWTAVVTTSLPEKVKYYFMIYFDRNGNIW